MECKYCNAMNQDGAKFCVSCGAKLEEEPVIQNINDYSNNSYNNTYNTTNVPEYKQGSTIAALVFSILCCGGVIGAIFAILGLTEGNKVKDFVQQGNIELANQSLAQAKKWTKFAWVTNAIISVLFIVYYVVMIGMTVIAEF